MCVCVCVCVCVCACIMCVSVTKLVAICLVYVQNEVTYNYYLYTWTIASHSFHAVDHFQWRDILPSPTTFTKLAVCKLVRKCTRSPSIHSNCA